MSGIPESESSNHSHSIVANGLDVMSYATRLTSATATDGRFRILRVQNFAFCWLISSHFAGLNLRILRVL